MLCASTFSAKSFIARLPLQIPVCTLHKGYEPSVVPMMVEGVPSVVQCLRFVGELLQQSSQQCQVFAVIPTAHIVCSYSALPQILNTAQQVEAQVSHVRSKV